MSVEKVPELDFGPTRRQSLLNSVQSSLLSQVGNRDNDIVGALAIDQFYVNADIAGLFGLNAGSFTNTLRKVSPPEGERNGLLTHPAYLSVHSNSGGSGIIKRGVFTLEQLLCVEMGSPPDNVSELSQPVDVDPDTTSTRELLQLQHTTQPACIGCHTHIDPAGFGYENYDTLGRFRMFEKGTVPIDSSGAIMVPGIDPIIFDNHIEFTNELMNSTTFHSCMTRRFLESVTGDTKEELSCEFEKLTDDLDSEQVTIRRLVEALAKLESLRIRN